MRDLARDPTDDELMLVKSSFEQLYNGFPSGPVAGWSSYEHFYKCLGDLDNQSSPGFPYMREKPTIGQWLEADGLGSYSPVQVQRLWYDVQLVMSGQYEHYFRVFVKDEPHKISKVEAGKWRLIMAASLPVQMVWRMCFSHQNDWLNDHPYTTPSAHGLVFCYGGWRRFKAHARTKSLVYSRDLSAWDWGAPLWVLQLIRDFRVGNSSDIAFTRVVNWLYKDAFEDTKLLFSNGLVVQQRFGGMMKSGLYVTISDNSLSMVGLHLVAGLRSGMFFGSVWATGDDVLQQYWSEEYSDRLLELGGRVKEVERSLIFMGTSFEKEPEPMYYAKHLVNLAAHGVDELPEVLDGYMRLYAYSKKSSVWKAVADEADITLRTPQYYQFWYGSPLARVLSHIWN